MKNKILVIFFCFVCTSVFLSCATKLSSGYTAYSEPSEFYGVMVDEVDASVDLAYDSEIAFQIAQIVDSLVVKNQSEHILFLEIAVHQRDFSRTFRPKNSQYVSFWLTDNDGTVLFHQGFYTITRKTVISLKEQYEISQRIAGRVNHFIHKSKKQRKKNGA